MIKIHKLAEYDKPREKLLIKGPTCLSDLELIAALLGRGIKRRDVLNLSAETLDVINQFGSRITYKDLCEIRGLGPAQASRILAAQEFFRRRIKPSSIRILSAVDVYSNIRHLACKDQERFLVIALNGAQEMINVRTVTIGLVDSVQIHPREVFAEALVDRAAALVIAHNHPSSYLEPSKADIKVTKALLAASKLLGIILFDHIIFNEQHYLSMREKGFLRK